MKQDNACSPDGSALSAELGPLPEPMKDYPEPGERTYTGAALLAFGAQERAAERERARQVLSDRLAGTVMSKYASNAECEAARAALRNAMLDVWGA